MALFLGGKDNTPRKEYPRIGVGQHPARVVQVVDLGLQPKMDWNTKVETDRYQVLFTFEFPLKMIDVDGVQKPRWFSKTYLASSNDQSNLYQVVSSINPVFDFETDSLSSLLGEGCMVQIGTTATGKDKIVSVNPLIEGYDIPDLVNEPLSFDLSEPDLDVFKKLQKWVQRIIVNSKSYKTSALSVLVKEDGYTVD